MVSKAKGLAGDLAELLRVQGRREAAEFIADNLMDLNLPAAAAEANRIARGYLIDQEHLGTKLYFRPQTAVQGEPLHPSQVRALRRNVKRNCPPEIYALLDQAITAPQPTEQQAASDIPGLTEALRQYQHNDGSGLVFGYDRLLVDQYVTQLVEALDLALEYWRDRQQRYKNRRPKWVVAAESALADLRK